LHGVLDHDVDQAAEGLEDLAEVLFVDHGRILRRKQAERTLDAQGQM
jgi:hypothetical protein